LVTKPVDVGLLIGVWASGGMAPITTGTFPASNFIRTVAMWWSPAAARPGHYHRASVSATEVCDSRLISLVAPIRSRIEADIAEAVRRGDG
jgi:hypothetical protein